MSQWADWLPAQLQLEGDESQALEVLQTWWLETMHGGSFSFQGIPVRWDQSIQSGEMLERGFWHVVSRDPNDIGVRRLDRSRAARLPWLPFLLLHADDSTCSIWDYRHPGRRTRTYIWYRDGNYVIVLEYRDLNGIGLYYIVTAFVVDGRSSERTLQRQYKNRVV